MKKEMKKSETKKRDDYELIIILIILWICALILLIYVPVNILPNPLMPPFISSKTFYALYVSLVFIFGFIIEIIWRTHKANKKQKAENISKQKKLFKASKEEEETQKMNLKIELMEALIHNSIPESQRENMFTKLQQLHEEREKTRESDMKALKSFINSKTQTLETNLEDIKESMKGIVEDIKETYLKSHENMIKEIDELHKEREKISIKDMSDLKGFVQTELATLRSDLLSDVIEFCEEEEISDEIIDEIKKPIEEVKTNVKSLSKNLEFGNQEMSKEIQAISALKGLVAGPPLFFF